ncbi:hypothetical protein VCO01S_36170 [Vibrio comitans NBRC 102076]|uniref:Uncharacterized protein n=1 Tax=Vibrio comitans NBRC 102076 TaxID=1219078 RepID=A0A4Y3IU40_9VIBR|nr:hypothetical protein VCO01S_36170 [Vibrio comitans NBRC 102076]
MRLRTVPKMRRFKLRVDWEVKMTDSFKKIAPPRKQIEKGKDNASYRSMKNSQIGLLRSDITDEAKNVAKHMFEK